MKVYELTNSGCEIVECYLPPITFQEDKVFCSLRNENELRLEYDLENVPLNINCSHFSVLLQDIHNNIPCGMLFVSVPVGESYDTIIYIVRFSEKEFNIIKKFA